MLSVPGLVNRPGPLAQPSIIITTTTTQLPTTSTIPLRPSIHQHDPSRSSPHLLSGPNPHLQ